MCVMCARGLLDADMAAIVISTHSKSPAQFSAQHLEQFQFSGSFFSAARGNHYMHMVQ